jgi:hypothetical protein
MCAQLTICDLTVQNSLPNALSLSSSDHRIEQMIGAGPRGWLRPHKIIYSYGL